MDFIVKFEVGESKYLSVCYVDEFAPDRLESCVLYVKRLAHLDYIDRLDQDGVYEFGDIIKSNTLTRGSGKGFYYTIKVDRRLRQIEIISDYHSYLPVYYLSKGREVFCSSSVDTLNRLVDERETNCEFFIQQALLNVPFGSTCFLSHLKRMRYGSKLIIDINGIEEKQTRRFYDNFLEHPVPYKKALTTIVKLFLTETQAYFEDPVCVSLTGGFDGRTALAAAHYHKNPFCTYSHGKPENDDVYIPQKISSRFGFEHITISLQDEYVTGQYRDCVNEYLLMSGGMNGFLYPHFVYDFSRLSSLNRPIITGFVGSELLRNANASGAVSSRALIDVISGHRSIAAQNYMSSDAVQSIKQLFSIELVEHTIRSVSDYIDQLPDWLSQNQKLACFEFEEVIPKLFGTWIYIGLHYARVRAPFVDEEFFMALARTEISQFYRKYLEHNPIKRFWGQYLYARIINATWPELGACMSGKGYAPNDLLSVSGRVKIAVGYIAKKHLSGAVDYDNLALISGLRQYRGTLPDPKGLAIGEGLYSVMRSNQRLRDLIFLHESQRVYEQLLWGNCGEKIE